ncbi:hypothetical protein [Arenibacter amylolyticus]|uniref:hypothetical protein n=1 Tax=Arenibacter amylolyticus TaxID=1406873 RepID=UPI000A39AF69|nr:hypothetical protein [Arenibacter amylolyticus]
MKKVILKGLMVLWMVTISCTSESVLNVDPIPEDIEFLEGVSAKASMKSTAMIGSPIPGTNISGISTLHRNNNGITVNFKVEGLIPGAYTIWWVIWNQPENCAIPGACNETDFANAANVAVDVLYAAGHVVGKNGKGNFSAHLKEGDNSESINQEFFGLPPAGGLQLGNALTAEVHVVLRTHGPKVPGLVNEQIGSYEGGCDNPILYPPFSVYPNVVGECADIAAAIHPPGY